ncbi:DUF5615 family PIN-like protein [Salinigranum halophilum]|uniref:DUF5615 family PIN-like protein n=1 Tax=Salinigranum halophilum TaxID=2565931 RepID=UPI0010A80520|nr:DUF5615 family PIN-like protein [Salinigranum halophilum]
MSYRLLVDENGEYRIVHKLRNYGHDVEHVDDLAVFGKGASDRELGEYSKSADRLLLTYDDDFILELTDSEYRAALYVNDVTIPSGKIADAIHRMAKQYPQAEVDGVVSVEQ